MPHDVSVNPPLQCREAEALTALAPPKRSVRLFRNGANQALRIPKEFELPGHEALIHRDGDRLVIEPIRPVLRKGSAAALLLLLQSMAPIDEDFPDIGKGLLGSEDVTL